MKLLGKCNTDYLSEEYSNLDLRHAFIDLSRKYMRVSKEIIINRNPYGIEALRGKLRGMRSLPNPKYISRKVLKYF